MTQISNRSPQTGLQTGQETGLTRRNFLVAAGAVGLTGPQGQAEPKPAGPRQDELTGNGEWLYRVVPGWGHRPSGTEFGGTHGGITVDRAGQVYVSTQSSTGILVYREIASTAFSAAHGCFVDQESNIYISDWNHLGRVTKLVRVKA
jgi:hypothetical protein